MAVSFLLGGVAEQIDEHVCAHHDASPSSQVHGGGGASHAHHGVGTGADEADSGDEGQGPCTCLGACAAGSAPGLPTAATGTLEIAHVRAESGARRPGDVLLARSPAFLLPYANAPPLLG